MRAFVIALVLALGTIVVAPVHPAHADRIENIKKRIRQMRAAAIASAIDLDEKQSTKLFPLLAKFDDENEVLARERAALARKLEDATTSKNAKEVDKVIDDAAANQKKLWKLEEDKLAEIRKILTPQQTAKLLIVLPEWERKMQNRLRKALDAKEAKKAKKDGPDDDDIE